jgi:N6-L-threonylcarbamoyladenine synthase
MPITILAIESSCDDTAAAVLQDGKILSNLIATQKIHEQYGGVVPELASRAHMQNIVPVVDEALKKAACKISDVDAIAFTQAPGLIGSLLVGSQFAKSLSLALGKPIICKHMYWQICCKSQLQHFLFCA